MPGERGVTELLPGLLMLKRTWGSNVYLIDSGEPVLIDAGFPLDTRRVFSLVSIPSAPVTAVATHYHLDHVGALAGMNGRVCSIAAHDSDAEVMEGKAEYGLFRVDRLRTVYYHALGPFFFPMRKVTVDRRLAPGEIICGLEVVHVPGHTPGSIALYDPGEGYLFTGDCVRNEGGVLDGPPPQFTPGIEDSYFNIRERLLDLDFDVLLPGHGPPILSGGRRALYSMMEKQGRLSL